MYPYIYIYIWMSVHLQNNQYIFICIMFPKILTSDDAQSPRNSERLQTTPGVGRFGCLMIWWFSIDFDRGFVVQDRWLTSIRSVTDPLDRGGVGGKDVVFFTRKGGFEVDGDHPKKKVIYQLFEVGTSFWDSSVLQSVDALWHRSSDNTVCWALGGLWFIGVWPIMKVTPTGWGP